MRKAFAFAAALAVVFTVGVSRGHAQVPDRPRTNAQDTAKLDQLQQRLTPAQQAILSRLLESGMTREQVRQRLSQAGYDPNLADRYFDELEKSDSLTEKTPTSRFTRRLTTPSKTLIGALRTIGILTPADSLDMDMPRADSLLRRPRQIVKDTTPQVFGRELFAAATQFEPILMGPVDDDYRLGPGDELTLIVTGDVELMYDLTVTREGYIIVPDVGQVLINGLTLDQAKNRLNERLARVYSGVQIGTTQSDLAVGRVRNKLIYVAGDVEVPNAYQMSGTATVFGALYRAGGPKETGSFRRIEVRRSNKVIQRVDLYEYLLRGDKAGDVRLEQGDVVFVPLVGRQVTVVGGVRRPAIFELLDHEGLADALSFAGGGQANAAIERIVVDRILPPGQRQPGRERVLVDVTLSDLVSGQPVAVNDGDRVTVSEISMERRNRVTVKGDVQRGGEYEYRAGMTALDLVNAASGLTPTAYTPIAHIIRLNAADSSTMLLRVNFDDPSSAEYAGSLKLADLDELRVHGRARLANPKRIEVFGFVKEEGEYPLAEGMTVEDAVLLAGGFQDGAAEGLVEVARRRPLMASRGDSLATVHRVAVSLGTTPSKGSAAPEPFRLADGDQVFIRRHPGYQPLSTVELIGEIMYPGSYALAARGETVSEVVRRAGGLTPEAHAMGLRVYRDSIAVGIDLKKAMKRPGSKDDLELRPGDRIEVPRFDATVLVTGAVAFESRVQYQENLDVKDYIARAGGPKPEGIVGRTAVRYPNGELRTPTRPILFKRYPKVEPGSTIIVPERGQAGTGPSFDSIMGRAAAVLGSIATIFLTANALK